MLKRVHEQIKTAEWLHKKFPWLVEKGAIERLERLKEEERRLLNKYFTHKEPGALGGGEKKDMNAPKDDREALEKAKKLREEWRQALASMRLDQFMDGMDEFNARISELLARGEELKEKFKGIRGAKAAVDEWMATLGKAAYRDRDKAEEDASTNEKVRLGAEVADRRAEFERNVTEATETEIQARLRAEDEWVREQNVLMIQAGIDYEERQARMVEVTRIAEERKLKIIKESRKAMREAEINYRLGLIDLAESERSIGREEAARERLALNKELLAIQKEHLGTLDKLKDPAAWYAQMEAINAVRGRIIDLKRQNLELTGSFKDGWKDALKDYLQNVQTAFQQGARLAQTAAQEMERAFSDFFFDVFRGKMKSLWDYLSAFLESIGRQISNIMGQQMTAAIMGGLFHGGGLVMHRGGLVPRFHFGGLAADEVPAILQKGEYVVSRRGVEALDRINRGQSGGVSVVVNVENRSSLPVAAETGGARFDGEKYVVGVVLKDIRTGGPLSRLMRR